MRTLANAVARGQILYCNFPDTPEWYVAKVATLAAAHGPPGPIGLHNAWSLTERGVKLDLRPMAQEFGLGIMRWSPLAGGLLFGKNGREILEQADRASAVSDRAMRAEGGSRDPLSGDNPYGAGCAGVRVVVSGHGVVASRCQQVTDNFNALKVRLIADQLDRLNAVSAVALLNPYFIFQLPREVLFGGQSVTLWRPG